MSKILISILLLFNGILYAQTKVTPDKRLYSKYTEDYIDKLIVNNPNFLKYLNFSLDNSYKIIRDLNDLKTKDIPLIKKFDKNSKTTSDVESIDLNTFNLMEYDFIRKHDSRNYYKLANSGAIIVLYSEKELIKNFKRTTK